MAISNAINEQTTGICGFTGTAFTGTPVTNHAVIVGGSTSSTLTNVGPTATAGQVLQSAGSSADPVFSTATYPSTATGTGTILRANGTNWVPSTATYPDTAGTSGNVLTSDGTNWTSQPSSASAFVKNAQLTLTSAQIKGMFATQVTLVPAQGANTLIYVISGSAKFIYGGTNVFTGGGDVRIYYNNSSGIQPLNNFLFSSFNMQGTANLYTMRIQQGAGIQAVGAIDNLPIVIGNAVGAYAGNAANDNTLIVQIAYYVVTLA